MRLCVCVCMCVCTSYLYTDPSPAPAPSKGRAVTTLAVEMRGLGTASLGDVHYVLPPREWRRERVESRE
jgi:hypothetical protein